jgi:transposase
MRPSPWHPPVEPSSFEQTIITRIKRAKLFVFLRHHRHELFDDAFQEGLATLYHSRLARQVPDQVSNMSMGFTSLTAFSTFANLLIKSENLCKI